MSKNNIVGRNSLIVDSTRIIVGLFYNSMDNILSIQKTVEYIFFF